MAKLKHPGWQCVRRLRQTLCQATQRKIRPYLHGSSYVDRTSADGTVQLAILRRERQLRSAHLLELREGVKGFTACGVIVDSYAGGLVSLSYAELPVEDMLALAQLVDKLAPSSFRKH